MTTPLDKFPKSPELDEFIEAVARKGYRERRQILWGKVQSHLPRFLYKFRSLNPSDDTSIDRMRDILTRSRLWLSSPLDFNDPFDMSAKIIVEGTIEQKRQRLRNILKRRGLKSHEISSELPRLAAHMNEEIAEIAQRTLQTYAGKFGVCSFGGDPRSILMWSHYASNHEGFCLQLEVAKDLKSFGRLVRVTYEIDYPVMNWINEDEFFKGVGATLERKHKHWKYEREVRIIIPGAAHESLPFQPDALRAIVIGCRVVSTTMECLQKLLSERLAAGLPTPVLYRAFKHESKYKIVIKKAE